MGRRFEGRGREEDEGLWGRCLGRAVCRIIVGADHGLDVVAGRAAEG